MASTARSRILTSLLAGSLALTALPAGAFSLFGIHLWGRRDDAEDPFAVIDPLNYQVTLDVAGGDEGLRRRLEGASALWTDRERPVSGTGGLLSKARGDYRRLLAALYAAGYYGPEISIRAAGQEVADLTLAVEFPEGVPVAIRVVPGPPFRFGATEIVNRPPREVSPSDEGDGETPESVGFVTGEPAYSGVIDQVSAISIERWRQLAYAKARESGREVVADHARDRLDVALTLDPGRPARYGPVAVAGRTRVEAWRGRGQPGGRAALGRRVGRRRRDGHAGLGVAGDAGVPRHGAARPDRARAHAAHRGRRGPRLRAPGAASEPRA